MKSIISPFVVDNSSIGANVAVGGTVGVGLFSSISVIIWVGEDVFVGAGGLIGELAIGVHAANPMNTMKTKMSFYMFMLFLSAQRFASARCVGRFFMLQ